MAYTSKHLRAALDLGGIVGGKLWVLDTIEATTDVDTAGYLSDAREKGMRKGDIVIVRIWTTSIPVAESEIITPDGTANDLVAVGFHFVIGINATTGAADLTNVLAITATNTD